MARRMNRGARAGARRRLPLFCDPNANESRRGPRPRAGGGVLQLQTFITRLCHCVSCPAGVVILAWCCPAPGSSLAWYGNGPGPRTVRGPRCFPQGCPTPRGWFAPRDSGYAPWGHGARGHFPSAPGSGVGPAGRGRCSSGGGTCYRRCVPRRRVLIHGRAVRAVPARLHVKAGRRWLHS
jgi:hypothetical protein